MIARIDFENEHVIHTRSTPAVRVESDENDLQDDKKRAAIELDGHFPVEWKLFFPVVA